MTTAYLRPWQFRRAVQKPVRADRAWPSVSRPCFSNAADTSSDSAPFAIFGSALEYLLLASRCPLEPSRNNHRGPSPDRTAVFLVPCTASRFEFMFASEMRRATQRYGSDIVPKIREDLGRTLRQRFLRATPEPTSPEPRHAPAVSRHGHAPAFKWAILLNISPTRRARSTLILRHPPDYSQGVSGDGGRPWRTPSPVSRYSLTIPGHSSCRLICRLSPTSIDSGMPPTPIAMTARRTPWPPKSPKRIASARDMCASSGQIRIYLPRLCPQTREMDVFHRYRHFDLSTRSSFSISPVPARAKCTSG